MFVGVLRLELVVFESGSLKAKRHVVKGLTSGARAKFGVAAAEVDNQDLWQRASIGVASVSQTAFHSRKVLQEVERWVSSDGRVQILSSTFDVVSMEDR